MKWACPSGRWAPRTRYVEIYVDGRYQGLYLLVERIKRDKARINLPAPAPDATTPGDLTGGYIFSQEGDGGRAGADWPSPFDPRGKLVYRYPRADVITAAQKSYLQEAVRGLAQALTAEPRLSEATRKRLDVPSFLDYVLVQELVNNVDAYWKSWFLYKAPDAAGGRFFMGPLWDFDLGYGNIIFKKRYCANTSASSELGGPFAALLKDAEVKDSLRCRWNTLRAAGGPLDLARLEDKIAAFSRHMKTAKARDQERWRNIGAWIWPNNYIGASWTDEVTYLRYWLRKRLAWLDQSLAGTCPDGARARRGRVDCRAHQGHGEQHPDAVPGPGRAGVHSHRGGRARQPGLVGVPEVAARHPAERGRDLGPRAAVLLQLSAGKP